MIHRKDEIAAVLAILESDYESGEDMAKAAIERCFELFQARDMFGLRYGVAYGPWLFRAQAVRASNLLQGLATVHTLHSTTKYMGIVDKFLNMKDPKYCPHCEHPTFAHTYPNHVGCVVRTPKPCTCTRMYK